ncbi:hypothetical protein BH11BAC1_BH11BAC1_21040 [soil metagenome]
MGTGSTPPLCESMCDSERGPGGVWLLVLYRALVEMRNREEHRCVVVADKHTPLNPLSLTRRPAFRGNLTAFKIIVRISKCVRNQLPLCVRACAIARGAMGVCGCSKFSCSYSTVRYFSRAKKQKCLFNEQK